MQKEEEQQRVARMLRLGGLRGHVPVGLREVYPGFSLQTNPAFFVRRGGRDRP